MLDQAVRSMVNFRSLRQSPIGSPQLVRLWPLGPVLLQTLMHREPRSELRLSPRDGSTEFYPGRNIQRPLLLRELELRLRQIREGLARAVSPVALVPSLFSAPPPLMEFPVSVQALDVAQFW